MEVCLLHVIQHWRLQSSRRQLQETLTKPTIQCLVSSQPTCDHLIRYRVYERYADFLVDYMHKYNMAEGIYRLVIQLSPTSAISR